MRLEPAVLLCLAGCTVDTSHLEQQPNVGGWVSRTRSADLVEPAVLSGTGEPDESEPTPAPSARSPRSLPVDLAAVLQLAGSGAVEIELARASAREAAHLAESAQASALPSLSPRLAFFRHEGVVQDTGGAFFDTDKQNATAGAGLVLAFDPAEAIYGALAALRRADAAGASYRASVDGTLLRAASAYFALAESHARLGIAREDVRAARELLEVEEARERAGAGLPAAVARARARLAGADGNLEQAASTVETDTASLVAVLGLEPGTVLLPRIADAVATIELVDAGTDLEALLRRAFAENPELDAARSLIEAASVEEDMTRWGWLIPEVQVGATFDGFGPDLGDLGGRENYFLGAQWRLDFGLPSRHQASVQRHVQAELRLTGLRDHLAASIVRSRSQVRAALARVAAARREVESAAESLALGQARHAEGADLLLQVLDAQAALTRARINLVTAVTDHNTAQYALLRAVGGPR